MQNRRTLYWLIFLGGAAVLAVLPEFFDEAPVEVVQPVEQRGALAELRSTPQAPVPAAPMVAQAGAHGGPEGAPPPPATPADARAATPTVDLFAAHSWYIAPPAPPPSAIAEATTKPPPPPAPSAPPMPFQFLGKLDDSEKLRVFLVRGERIYTVSAGDVIDGTYRVENISGTQMTLIYLPLNTAQTLSVGSNL